MTTNFNRAIARIFPIEGGFSNNPKDRGGATKFGITEAVARANGYTGRMEDLSEISAKRIAKSQYWDTLRLDEISQLSYPIAYELFDTGYNCGIGTSGTFLQRSLNALNREQKDYPDLKSDGVVGPMTVSALRMFLAKRVTNGETVLLRALNALQGAYYIDISKTRQQNETFVYGWFLGRVEIV